MPCRHLIVFATAAMLLAVLVACERAEPPKSSGSLYFGSGNYLARLNLRNGSTDIVASIGDADIQEISEKDERRFLLNVFGPVNQRNSHRLVLFDLESKQQLTFFEGRFGRYLADGQTLVYDDGSRIWATWKRVNYWEKVEVAQHPFNAKVWIVPVSNTTFLYSIGPESDGLVSVFDTVSRESTELGKLASTCDLEGATWIQSRSELLCRPGASKGEDAGYVFVSLEGEITGELNLPPNSIFNAVAYMPDQDAVVLTESWRSWMSGQEKWAVWIYDIGGASSYRLLEHQYLGRTVIYRPDPSQNRTTIKQ